MSLGTFALKSIQLLIALEFIIVIWVAVNRITTSEERPMTRDVRGVHNEGVSTTHGADVYRKDAPPAEKDGVTIAPSPARDNELAARHDVTSFNNSRKPKEVHNIFYLKVAYLYLHKFY